jgi:hypothetical protein
MNVNVPTRKLPTRLRFSPLMLMTLAALAAIDLVGALALHRALFPAERGEEGVRAEGRKLRLTQIEGEAVKPARVYSQTLSRPIFAKTRKPFVTNAAIAAPAAPPQDFRLAALASFGSHRRAFIISGSSPRGVWKSVGERIDGWAITQMEPAAIIMEDGAASVTLKLYPVQQGEMRRRPDLDSGRKPSAPLVPK